MNRIIYSIFFLSIININCATAPQKLDLANVRFTENVESLLKGIPVTKEAVDKGIIQYKISDLTKCTFAGANMEFSVKLEAQHHIISSVYAETEKTASTNQVLKFLISKYRQPTYKIRDDGETKAYYWKTPTLFIRFMSGEVISPTDGKQIFSFVNIATLKALKNGVDPTLADVYKYIQSRNIK